jgi:hypothetical protein
LADQEKQIEDFEYLLHHIAVDEDGNEEIHHCFVIDQICNLFTYDHLIVHKGKVEINGKNIKEGIFHVITGLEPSQELVWSEEDAEENDIKPKKVFAGMTLKEKAKEWQ